MIRIVIAEDDFELRQLFGHVLMQNGFSVKGVQNGKEALEALELEKFDMIISDIMMPVVDGYTLVRKIREAGNNIPVLMITAKDALILVQTIIWLNLLILTKWC